MNNTVFRTKSQALAVYLLKTKILCPKQLLHHETFNKRQDKIRKKCSNQNTNSNTNITSQLLFKYHYNTKRIDEKQFDYIKSILISD